MFRYLIILCLMMLTLSAQKEYNNWYFGSNKGITFNTPDGEPVPLPGGKISVGEGCCTISDADGNLLFYVARDKIRNRNHLPMPHDMGKKGAGPSSTQGAVIVRKPGSDHIYYVITCGQYEDRIQNTDTSHVRLWTVDMHADNGLGDLVGESVVLFEEEGEQLAVYPHANKKDVWLVATQWSGSELNYRVFLISESGVNEIHKIFSPFGYPNITGQGHLKFSPDGQYIAAAHVNNGIELARFDNCTGLISENILLTPFFPFEAIYYSVEFSPDGKKLYGQNSIPQSTAIVQYDISDYSQEAIERTLKTVPMPVIVQPDYRILDLQRGPNGKIYIVSCGDCDNYHSIENPDDEAEALRFMQYSYGGHDGTGHLTFPTPVIYSTGDYTCLGGDCTIDGEITAADTVISTGDRLCMPVRLKMKCRQGKNFLPEVISIDLRVGYNPRLFKPDINGQTVTFDTLVSPTRRVTGFRFDDVRPDQAGEDTLFICGQSYLNDTLHSVFEIADIAMENKGDISYRDGSVTLSHCAGDMRQVLMRPSLPVIVETGQSSGNTTISIETAEEGMTEVQVYDLMGSLVDAQIFIKSGAHYSRHELNIDKELAKGVYFINVRSGRQAAGSIFLVP